MIGTTRRKWNKKAIQNCKRKKKAKNEHTGIIIAVVSLMPSSRKVATQEREEFCVFSWPREWRAAHKQSYLIWRKCNANKRLISLCNVHQWELRLFQCMCSKADRDDVGPVWATSNARNCVVQQICRIYQLRRVLQFGLERDWGREWESIRQYDASIVTIRQILNATSNFHFLHCNRNINFFSHFSVSTSSDFHVLHCHSSRLSKSI